MTPLEARHIAQEYASEMGEVLPGFIYGIGDEENFTDKYYFDFIWLTLDGRSAKEPPVAGGPRGLTVNKHDREVNLTTFGGYSGLKDRESKLIETYQLLSDFKNRKIHLSEVKTKFDLNSDQLLQLSKIIESTELDKGTTYETINQLLNKVRNYR